MHVATVAEDVLDQLSATGDEMLAVVQNHEETLCLEELFERLNRWATRLFGHPEGRGHPLGNAIGIGQRGQLDEPNAVGIVGNKLPCNARGEARLTRASRAGEGDQSIGEDSLLELHDLAGPTNEARQLGG